MIKDRLQSTDEAQEALREAFEALVAAMVHHRDAVKVRLSPSARWPVLVLSCARSDYGTVIGTRGSTLEMLRLLARIAAQRAGFAGVDVDVDESACTGEWRSGQPTKMVPRQDWDATGFEMLLQTFCAVCFGPCSIAMDQVTHDRTKVAVAVLEPLPTGTNPDAVDGAMRKVFKCAGAMYGQLVNVDVEAAEVAGDRLQ